MLSETLWRAQAPGHVVSRVETGGLAGEFHSLRLDSGPVTGVSWARFEAADLADDRTVTEVAGLSGGLYSPRLAHKLNHWDA